MTSSLAISIILTAILTALLTWLFAYLLYRGWMSRRLEAELELLQDAFEQRVRKGVLAAGEELMPELRKHVRLGFQDALRNSETGELVENYATAVNRGADVISNRLGGLFGIKPKK